MRFPPAGMVYCRNTLFKRVWSFQNNPLKGPSLVITENTVTIQRQNRWKLTEMSPYMKAESCASVIFIQQLACSFMIVRGRVVCARVENIPSNCVLECGSLLDATTMHPDNIAKWLRSSIYSPFRCFISYSWAANWSDDTFENHQKPSQWLH